MSNDFIDRLARQVARSDSQPAYVPRAPQLSLHMGTLTAVDNSTNTAHFQFNDPSGLILPGVRVLQAYSASNIASAGDIVWGFHNGTDFMIAGQHMVPTNTVTP